MQVQQSRFQVFQWGYRRDGPESWGRNTEETNRIGASLPPIARFWLTKVEGKRWSNQENWHNRKFNGILAEGYADIPLLEFNRRKYLIDCRFIGETSPSVWRGRERVWSSSWGSPTRLNSLDGNYAWTGRKICPPNHRSKHFGLRADRSISQPKSFSRRVSRSWIL